MPTALTGFQFAGEAEDDGADKEPAFSLLGRAIDGISCVRYCQTAAQTWLVWTRDWFLIGYGAPY